MMLRPQDDPNKRLTREPGDVYTYLGICAGSVVRAVVSVVIGFKTGTYPVLLAVSAIAGGFAGTFIGDAIKKSRRKKRPQGKA